MGKAVGLLLSWDFPSSGFSQEKVREGFLVSESFALSESSFCLIGIKLCRRTKAGWSICIFLDFPVLSLFKYTWLNVPRVKAPHHLLWIGAFMWVVIHPMYQEQCLEIKGKAVVSKCWNGAWVWVFLSSAFLSHLYRYHVCEHAAAVNRRHLHGRMGSWEAVCYGPTGQWE